MFAGISHFKSHYQTLYDDWMANGAKTYTKGGHQRAPTKRQVCEWVLESWRQLPEEAIKESFRSCGITVSITGLGDDHISCMKDGREAAAAKPIVKKKTEALMRARADENDSDPFSDLSDDEEPEEDYIEETAAKSEEQVQKANLLELFNSSEDEEDDFPGF